MVATGFLTTKGQLVRDIMFPRDMHFKFYRDSYKFVGIMALTAIIGFLSTVPTMLKIGVDVPTVIDRGIDLFTICIPPVLPAAMTVGIVFAVNRLKAQKIFCISPTRVNIAGRVQTMVFDKTGTITEDSLSVLGARAADAASFSKFESDVTKLVPEAKWWTISDSNKLRNSSRVLFLESMASCHEVTCVKGQLMGDPLDIQMFKATSWVLNEDTQAGVLAAVYPGDVCTGDNYSSAILRRFEFSSSLQRMSVVCHNSVDNRCRAFVKGSPEMIASLCQKNTLPSNFNDVLKEYAQEGYRVIAIGHKLMNESFKKESAGTYKHEEIESDLQFLGLLVMENKLKPESTPALKTLNECEIRTVLATGDNVLTAISVAKNCKMLNGEKALYLGELKQQDVVWTRIEGSESKNAPKNQGSNGLPWSFDDPNIEVALTGPAFNQI